MKLYITDINTLKDDDIERISPKRADRARRYRKSDDRKRCIAGGLFIKKFLGDANITLNKYGKPVADNGVHFNLSHSGRYVLFAISESAVGCDIEKIKIVNSEKLGKIVLCQNEMCRLYDAFDRTEQFFELWTKKESLLKCMGEGFHRNAKTVDVSGKLYYDKDIKKNYYFKIFRFSDYTVSVCSVKNDFPNTVEFITL